MAKALKVIPSTPPETNFFSEYARVAGQNSAIVGQLLKFSKGDYVVGQDSESMDIGTKLVANMEHLLVGWQRWEDQRPVEQEMGPVMEGFMPKQRMELSFADKSEWDVDESSGKPRDPWVYTHLLLLKALGKNGQLYTFTTNSAGGKNAMAKLCGTYGKEMREHPDEWPIVKLGVGMYKHPEFGKVQFPIFEIVGWSKKSEFDLKTLLENVEDKEPTATKRKIR